MLGQQTKECFETLTRLALIHKSPCLGLLFSAYVHKDTCKVAEIAHREVWHEEREARGWGEDAADTTEVG